MGVVYINQGSCVYCRHVCREWRGFDRRIYVHILTGPWHELESSNGVGIQYALRSPRFTETSPSSNTPMSITSIIDNNDDCVAQHTRLREHPNDSPSNSISYIAPATPKTGLISRLTPTTFDQTNTRSSPDDHATNSKKPKLILNTPTSLQSTHLRGS